MIGEHALWLKSCVRINAFWRAMSCRFESQAHHPLPQWRELVEMRERAEPGRSPFANCIDERFSRMGLSDPPQLGFSNRIRMRRTPCGIASDEMLDPEAMYSNIRNAEQPPAFRLQSMPSETVRIERSLDFYERVSRDSGPRDRRLRIEHAQHLKPADIPTFRATWSGGFHAALPLHRRCAVG